MSFADSGNRHVRHLRTVPLHRRSDRQTSPRERVSDCWPDFSTALTEDEVETAQGKNKPGIVLKEAAGAVFYSVGLVVLLMAVLQLIQRA